MNRMIAVLLDLTRLRRRVGVPIARRPMDLQTFCEDVILELSAVHPDAALQGLTRRN